MSNETFFYNNVIKTAIGMKLKLKSFILFSIHVNIGNIIFSKQFNFSESVSMIE